MSENKQVSFNEGEAGALLQLLDLAVKSAGLQVAEAGVVLSKKIQEAFKSEAPAVEPEVVKEKK